MFEKCEQSQFISDPLLSKEIYTNEGIRSLHCIFPMYRSFWSRKKVNLVIKYSYCLVGHGQYSLLMLFTSIKRD